MVDNAIYISETNKHSNGDVQSKKSSVTESVYSKTKLSNVGDDSNRLVLIFFLLNTAIVICFQILVVLTLLKMSAKRRVPILAAAPMVQNVSVSLLSHISSVFQNHCFSFDWNVIVVYFVCNYWSYCGTWWTTVSIDDFSVMLIFWRMVDELNNSASIDRNAVYRNVISKCWICRY